MKRRYFIVILAILLLGIPHSGAESTNLTNQSKNLNTTINPTWIYGDIHRLTFSFEIDLPKNHGYLLCNSIVVKIGSFHPSFNFCEPLEDEEGKVLVTSTLDIDGFEFETPHAESVIIDLSNLLWIENQTFLNHSIQKEKRGDYGIHTFSVLFSQNEYDYTFIGSEIVAANGVELSLKKLFVNPTFSVAYGCLELPNQKDWLPKASLNAHEVGSIPSSYWKLIDYQNPSVSNSSSRCYQFFFLGDFRQAVRERKVVFSVDELKTSVPDNLKDLQDSLLKNEELLEGLGIRYHLEKNISSHELVIEECPDFMDQDSAIKLILDTLVDKVEGPWQINWK